MVCGKVGVHAMSITPFDRSGAIDTELLRTHLRFLGEAGVGVYVAMHELGVRGVLCFEPNVVPPLVNGVWAQLDACAPVATEPLLRLNAALARGGNPRSLKAALAIIGRNRGFLRRPYLPFTAAQYEELAHPGVALFEAVDAGSAIAELAGYSPGPEIARFVHVAVARDESVAPDARRLGHRVLVAPARSDRRSPEGTGVAGIVRTMSLLPRLAPPRMENMSRRVVFVVYPGITALDLVGPHEVFGAAAGYELLVAAAGAGPVATRRGPGIVADRSFASVRGPVDTLVIVGGEGSFAAARDPKLVRAVSLLARRSRRVTSVCTGAFVLAAAGLLDGKRATTHWSSCDRLEAKYPEVEVEGDRIFVQDGNVWTSAGVTAGMDLALALVADDLGQDVARAVARQLVMYVQRPGGQAQFSAQLSAQRATRDPLRELQGWIGEHPADDHAVERLAARVAMSPRHFARVFRAEVGCTPAAYVEQVRVEVARRLLETTALSVDEVAVTAGFSTPETLRRAFARRVGASPTEYRDRFRSFQPA